MQQRPTYRPPVVSTARAGHVVKNLGCINPGSAIGIGGFLCLVGSLFSPAIFTAVVMLAGVVLIVIGMIIERLCIRWQCSECRNRVEKESTLCPACRCLRQPRPSNFLYWATIMLVIMGGIMVAISLMAK